MAFQAHSLPREGARNRGICLARSFGCLAAFLAASPPVLGDTEVYRVERDTIVAAIRRIEPSLVQIQTLGGLETVEGKVVSQAPTTGVIVSEDGLILSSAVNFVQEPDGVVVRLASGSQASASIVARDRARLLVLLKIDPPTELSVPEIVPRSEMQVGQRVIAVGRGLDPAEPNVSVGILSALNRIWGRAIQTDAKVSSLNYGGPLIDLQGRVLGILAPMSPDDNSQFAGTELYDSGIGFAVPLVDLMGPQLERMRKGRDLRPGLLGVSLRGNNIYTEPAIIGLCPPRTPAREAGLKVGDEIIALDDMAVTRHVHLRHALGSKMAGDTVTLRVRRGTETIEASVTLAARIEPYDLPFLGILPDRSGLADKPSQGLSVRFVFPGSPAAAAGLQAGDRLISLNAEQPDGFEAWRAAISQLQPGDAVPIAWQRGDQSSSAEVTLVRQPDAVPEELPAENAEENLDIASERTTLQLTSEPNECLVLLPGKPNPERPWGLIVWLAPPGKVDPDEFFPVWEKACQSRGVMLLVPRPQDATQWQSAELATVRQFVSSAMNRYPVATDRVIAAGHQIGGSLAYALAFQNRELIHGVVVADAILPPALTLRGNDPAERLQFLILETESTSQAAAMQRNLATLREIRFPVASKKLPGILPPVTESTAEMIVRWADTLDGM